MSNLKTRVEEDIEQVRKDLAEKKQRPQHSLGTMLGMILLMALAWCLFWAIPGLVYWFVDGGWLWLLEGTVGN